MTALFHAMIEGLWKHIQGVEQGQAPMHGSRAPGPLGRRELAQVLGWDMARAWLRRHPAPASREALEAHVLAEQPAWARRLCLAWRCRRALEGLPESEYAWRDTPVAAAAGSNPGEGQCVLYHFKHVGTHAGYYAGGHVFCGLFGGFLTRDVTQWMPMPGIGDDECFSIQEP